MRDSILMTDFDISLAKEAVKKLFDCFKIKLPEETPERFVRMLSEMTQYQNISNQEIANITNKMFEIDTKSSDGGNMVLVKDIDAFSLCEHHIALIYDMKVSVAYMPHGRILGLSKIVRIVDMVCRRLQLQEKIGEDIAEIMYMITGSEDVAIHITAKHSCIAARGISNSSAYTVTTKLSGIFLSDRFAKDLFLRSIVT